MWPSAPRTRRAACMSINAVDHSTRSALSPSARTGSPHTITRAAKTTPENESQSTDTEEDEQGTAQEQGVTMREIVQRMGPLRLGVLSAVVFCLLSRAVSGAMASGMQLPGALAGSWAVQVSAHAKLAACGAFSGVRVLTLSTCFVKSHTRDIQYTPAYT